MPYIVWFDYGSGGWSPDECETLDDVLLDIHSSTGQDYIVTKRVDVMLVEKEKPIEA
jgi:hypothetical protein